MLLVPAQRSSRKSKLPEMSYLIAGAGPCGASACYVITAPSREKLCSQRHVSSTTSHRASPHRRPFLHLIRAAPPDSFSIPRTATAHIP